MHNIYIYRYQIVDRQMLLHYVALHHAMLHCTMLRCGIAVSLLLQRSIVAVRHHVAAQQITAVQHKCCIAQGGGG
jgi:hypothetical protein